MTEFRRSLVWFRRDLRLFDHAALHHALAASEQVVCAFVFDRDILDPLLQQGMRADRRVGWIHAAVCELDAELRKLGSGLIVRHASAASEIPRLAAEIDADAVFANRDYEPFAVRRDARVSQALTQAGRTFRSFKDQVMFETTELLTGSGTPFSVFTPYKNAWLKNLRANPDCLLPYEIGAYARRLAGNVTGSIPAVTELGFTPALPAIPSGMSGAHALLDEFCARMDRYDLARDLPAVKGPSYLSMHFRFGTLSIRTAVRRAVEAMQSGTGGSGAAVWLSELIWRDFYFMILHHHPHVAERAFKPEYDRIEWETGPEADVAFAAWCEGRTGYPLVDAAMHQLNQTGYMHNRLRMVTASFLVKDLGIDWRRGERYFAEKLNDFDLAANNGGWQWAASSGCDAQPYFRIFNPVTQSRKFDAAGKFIRRYLPRLAGLTDRDIHEPWLAPPERLEAAGIVLGTDYPLPIVRHDQARLRTLARYAAVRQGAPPEN